MAAKTYGLMIFIGVLMMTLSVTIFVRYTMDGPDPNAAAAPPRPGTTYSIPVRTSATGTGTAPPTTAPATPTRTPKPPTPPRTTTRPPTTTRPAVQPWRLVWSDEFDGSAVDAAKWNTADGVVADSACRTNRTENVSVSGGVLTLRAQREDYTCSSQPTPFTTAGLETTSSFTGGAFEVRARMPAEGDASTGLWPAFWLRSTTAEVQGVQAPGGPANASALTQSVTQLSTGTTQTHRGGISNGAPSADFHTYRVEWDPGVLRWTIDGTEVYRRDRTTTPWFDAAMTGGLSLRLTFGVGGWPGEPTDATALPSDFQVDYVRVYQR